MQDEVRHSRGGRSAAARIALFAGPAGALALIAMGAADPEHGAAWRMAGVAFWMACWWVGEALPLAATALLPVALFPVLGLLPAAETCAQYGHHLILLFLGGFLLARALSRWQVDERIALLVLRVAGGGTRGIVFGMMVASAGLSMWVSNSATAAMMMPVGLAVLTHASGESPTRRFGTAIMLGIAYAASIGGVGTLVGTPPNVLLAATLEDLAGIRIGFAEWMLVGVPVVALALPLVWAWLVFVAYPPESRTLSAGRALFAERLRELGPLTPGGRRTGAVVALTALAWLTRPLWEGLIPGALRLSDASVGIAGALLLFVVPAGAEGERLLERQVWRELPWNVLLIFGGGLALAKGFAETGLADALGALVVGGGALPRALFVVLVAAAVILLTEFASNTASTAMILPLLAASAAALGLPAPLLMVPAALAASMAFMMPAGTPPNAIVFGTGRVRLADMLRAGAGANLIALVVISVVVLVLLPLVWSLS